MPTRHEKAKTIMYEYAKAAKFKHQALVFATLSAGGDPSTDELVKAAKKRADLYRKAYNNFDEEPLLGLEALYPEA